MKNVNMSDRAKTILIVDDNPENIRIVADTLHQDDLKLAFAQSGEEALKRLKKSHCNLILMDVMMPGLDGFETARRIKENPEYAQIPIIFLTARNDEDSIEEAFTIGGVDYISKPFRARELIVRVQHQLERKEFIARLDYLASRDVLTGVYNRRKFFTLATELFDTHETGLYGVIIDIDHFKSVNDTHGHQAGDHVLKTVASVISDYAPAAAVLGRIGGEEFALIFLSESLENALQQVEKIRQSVEETPCELEDGGQLYCTISLGFAEKKQDIDTIDQLILEADKALYGAKTSGRNRVKVRSSRSSQLAV
ncbi:MAG: diguanylate cyclase [Candidatus Competibacteraceae bacterium]